jgi:hypothetical protein
MIPAIATTHRALAAHRLRFSFWLLAAVQMSLGFWPRYEFVDTRIVVNLGEAARRSFD